MTQTDVPKTPKERIGATAGAIWHLLDEEGAVSMTQLVKKVGEPRDVVMQGLGWLAREDKVHIDETGRKRTVSLCQ